MNSSISFTSTFPLSDGIFEETCLKQDYISSFLPQNICIDQNKSAAIYCRKVSNLVHNATIEWGKTFGTINNEERTSLKRLWTKVFDVFNQYSCGRLQNHLMDSIGILADLDTIKKLLETDYIPSMGDIAKIQYILSRCKYPSDSSEIGTVVDRRAVCQEGQDKEVFYLANERYIQNWPIKPIEPHNITYRTLVNESEFFKQVNDLNPKNLTLVRIRKVKKDDRPIKYFLNGEPFAIKSSHWDELTYRLDHEHFFKVLPVAKHPKLGYLMMWFNNTIDIPIQERLKNANPADLQRIFILDLRIHNHDRHLRNVIFTKHGNHIVTIPIDHDEIFYSYLGFQQLIDSLSDDHPAVAHPFTDECAKYIQNIDVDKDAIIMEDLGYDKRSIFKMKYNTVILKMLAKQGLTVKEIWRFFRFEYTSRFCRWEDFSPSTNLNPYELYKVSEKDFEGILKPALEKSYPKILDDFEYFQDQNCFLDERVIL